MPLETRPPPSKFNQQFQRQQQIQRQPMDGGRQLKRGAMLEAFETIAQIWVAIILVYGTIAVMLLVMRWAVHQISAIRKSLTRIT
jgi:hypothetical protein